MTPKSLRILLDVHICLGMALGAWSYRKGGWATVMWVAVGWIAASLILMALDRS